MKEVSTKALVLDKEIFREQDAKLTLYTQELGKVIAIAKSVYKPTSKLSAHLEPLSLVEIRLIKNNVYQAVDALLIKRFKSKVKDTVAVINLVKDLTLFEDKDEELWELLEKGDIFGASILKTLGFDPKHATCVKCSAENPAHFIIPTTEYLCKKCFTGGKHFPLN